MRELGEFRGAQRSLEGELILSFAVADDEKAIEWLEKHKDKKLVIEVKKYSEPRSLNANNYFWKLCEMLAQAMESTQDEVHDLMLYRYGQRGDLTFEKRMLPVMEQQFDIVIIKRQFVEVIFNEELQEFEKVDFVEARCWVGSRHYNKVEMSRLIKGTISDAHDYDIDLLNPEEVERLVSEWEKL